MEAERDVGHARMQRLAGDDGIADRRRGRKDAGEERVQRTAIIREAARACLGLRASVVTMAVSVLAISLMLVGLVVAGIRSDRSGSRMGLREWRRNDAGELGDQKQGDQKPNRARLCPEPLHDSSGRSGVNATFVRSVASVNPRPSCGACGTKTATNRPKGLPQSVPVWSATAPLPSPAFLV